MIRSLFMALVALSLASPVLAKNRGQIWPLAESDNLFAAGVPAEKFELFQAEKVEAEEMHWQYNWTMAASAQSLLNHQDLFEVQRDILYQIYGKKEDQPTGVAKVRGRLNGWKPEKGVGVGASDHKVQAGKIAADLEKYGPLLVGVEDTEIDRLGHPLILLQVIFEYDYFKNKVPVKVVLLDCWPDGREPRTEMTWYDFINHLQWALRLEVRGR
jgi:hypothetical protein